MAMTDRARARRAALRRGEGWCEWPAVARFWRLGFREVHIWNDYELRVQLGTDLSTLAAILEEVATEQRWLKLRDSNGLVRAIALPLNHPARSDHDLETHRALMVQRLLARGRWELMAA